MNFTIIIDYTYIYVCIVNTLLRVCKMIFFQYKFFHFLILTSCWLFYCWDGTFCLLVNLSSKLVTVRYNYLKLFVRVSICVNSIQQGNTTRVKCKRTEQDNRRVELSLHSIVIREDTTCAFCLSLCSWSYCSPSWRRGHWPLTWDTC